jgi:hypothetical protein
LIAWSSNPRQTDIPRAYKYVVAAQLPLSASRSVENKTDKMANKYHMNVTVLVNPGISRKEMLREILKAENIINGHSLLRFHFEEPKCDLNQYGCRPSEDVCLEHDEPLACPHGCIQAKVHVCKE